MAPEWFWSTIFKDWLDTTIVAICISRLEEKPAEIISLCI